LRIQRAGLFGSDDPTYEIASDFETTHRAPSCWRGAA
jgi:hypothetical protein